MNRSFLTRFAWLSIAASVVTMALKAAAYFLTGSVSLLSDAVESIVNLIGGIMALVMLTIAARPSDKDHAYGHSKAEYFSSGVEGTLIFIAAVASPLSPCNGCSIPNISTISVWAFSFPSRPRSSISVWRCCCCAWEGNTTPSHSKPMRSTS